MYNNKIGKVKQALV